MSFSGLGSALSGLLTPDVIEALRRQQALQGLGGPPVSQPDAQPAQSPYFTSLGSGSVQAPPAQITPQSAPWAAYESATGPFGNQPNVGALGPVRPANVGGDYLRQLQDTAIASADPAQREAAIRQRLGPAAVNSIYGPQFDKLRALQRQGPQHDVDEQGNPRHVGIGERLMHGLKTAGLAAVVSGGNPIAAIAGFALGTGNPQLYHNLRYNMIDLPRAQKSAQAESGLLDQQVGRAKGVEEMTGVSPLTGQPSEAAQRQTSIEDDRQERRDAIAQQRKEVMAEQHVKLAQSSGLPVDPNIVQGTAYESWAGKTIPKVGTGKQQAPWGHGVDKQGVWTGIYDDQTGEPKVFRPAGGASVQPTRDPSELTPYQQAELARQQQTDTRSRLNDARKDLKTYNELQTKAQQANTLATQVHNLLGNRANIKKDPKTGTEYVMYRGKAYTADDEEGLWAAVTDASDEWKRHGEYMGQTHGGLIKFTGDKAEINQGATQQAAPTPKGADPRIGKIFTAKDGKRYRVQSIDPADGQPILIPAP